MADLVEAVLNAVPVGQQLLVARDAEVERGTQHRRQVVPGRGRCGIQLGGDLHQCVGEEIELPAVIEILEGLRLRILDIDLLRPRAE
jgi:hypothetical protein